MVIPELAEPELAQKFMKLDPDLKILFITGYVDNKFDSSKSSQAQITILHKPFNIETLLRQIRLILDKK